MKEEFSNFITEIIEKDIATNKYDGRVHTRFPPEPNGYLHIGHAKSIWLNFTIAHKYNGLCNLRMDDTDPSKESEEFVKAIIEDVRWLGYDWGERLYFASDYYEQLYEYAVKLIQKGKAYVCGCSPEQVKELRGTLTEPGKECICRRREISENFDLFHRMKEGEFEDGKYVLRAKIDMAHPNLLMRDPVLYRIKKVSHYRTGDKWCIYPTYDFAHCICDSIEGITHSICTLEFEVHRPIYDWVLDELEIYHPQQIEFAPLNLSYTVLSKRKLRELVEQGYVNGWDDPRMPTICGLRRRGYTPEAIRNFCFKIGVSRVNSLVDIRLLEECLREDLNKNALRVMAVLRPLKVVIVNYPEDKVEYLEAVNNPEDPTMGTRKVPFSRELYIEREDFEEVPPPKFYRLAPGREVRLRYAYFIKCVEVKKNPQTGEIEEILCTYDPQTRGGYAPDGRKVKATLHWVSVPHAVNAEVRLYDYLFTKEDLSNLEEGEDFKNYLNPHSLVVLKECKLEPGLNSVSPGERFQFERLGYFCVDKDSSAGKLIFNRIVTLKDSWAKIKTRIEKESQK
ncbi:MAG: glutamine--tRNA ligase [Candidatus Omnitrophota bacterium]|nr:MAG: glutamine--tRNA ligase [Candidatus Omnitrophota bacterium]